MKCMGCGVNKDLAVEETYPYPEDERLCDGPLPPLFVLECQPNTKGQKWRMVVVCHECFKKLDPDMWIGEQCWISITPTTPFEKLPLDTFEFPQKWNLESYKEMS